MKFLVVLCLLCALVHGGVVTKKVSGEKGAVKSTEDLANDSADLINDDATESSTDKHEPNTNKDEIPVKKEEKQKKKVEISPEKPQKDVEKLQKNNGGEHNHEEQTQKNLSGKLEEELRKITEEPQTTQKPTPAPTPARKSSKNSAVSNEKRVFIVLTSFLIFVVTAFL